MKRLIILVTSIVLLANNLTANARNFPKGAYNVSTPKVEGVRDELLKNIAPIVTKSIEEGYYPGAVVLASHNGQVIYKGVFGNQSIAPKVTPMNFNTIFDIASMTKVIVTTTAVMQLVEQGKINLDTPVATYWPEFAKNGKDKITIRHLLTHYSGLPASITDNNWNGKEEAYKKITLQKLKTKPGSNFQYSDINFITLGYIVEIVSHEKLNDYAKTNIFKKLKMDSTFYKPSKNLKSRIAPTVVTNKVSRVGEVHDPITYKMGGVSGMAGVFSTANDIATFADTILNDGLISKNIIQERYLLSPLTIKKMLSPQTPDNKMNIRALGWDMDTKYSNRGVLFPIGSFGHTGWTGSSIWIDPKTNTYLIILTSRAHPTPAPANNLIKDRSTIANIIAASITDVSTKDIKNTSKGEIIRAY